MKKPKWWIDDIVVRALADYVAAPNVLHKAFAVTVFANHIADRVFHYYDEHDKSALLAAASEVGFLKAIIAAFPSHPDLQHVHDGADSIKHHFLFTPRTGSATRFPSTATGAMTATVCLATTSFLSASDSCGPCR